MEWLLAHMWMALAGVGLFGILFGWAVRGIMVMGKLHRAIGDKEVATAELTEARNELDTLLKAQRGEIPVQPHPVAAGGADDVLKRELKDREKRLADLAGELAKSKKELETLKTSNTRGGAAAAAVVGAAAGAAASAVAEGDGEGPQLAWRNRHLEARVKDLEAQLAAKPTAPAASLAAPVAAATAKAPADTAAEQLEADKAAWKIEYLTQRVAALEEEAMAAPPPVAVAQVETAIPVASASEETGESNDTGAVDEELARLRWRNRYLEGRLAYFEGDAPSDEEAEEAKPAAGLIAAGMGAAAVAVAETVAAGDEDEPEISETDATEIPAEDASVEAVAEAVEVVSAEIESDTVDEEQADEPAGSVSDAILKTLTEADQAADAEEASQDVADEAVADDQDEVDFQVEDEFEFDELDASDEPAGGDVEFIKPLALEGPVGGQADDLTVIGGVGPKIQEVLNGLGVYHYDQIAAWTPENVAWIDDHLSFAGRIEREGWVEQAMVLAGDD